MRKGLIWQTMRTSTFRLTFALLLSTLSLVTSQSTYNVNAPSMATPLSYVALKLRAYETIGTFDGRLDDAAWQAVPFTESFVDIRGAGFPTPRFETRAKMRWDDRFLYVGAVVFDNAIWANQTVRNSVIFQDNDFEVFVCPDGSNHYYKEFEMNAANTIWSLVLNQPYLNGGTPTNTLWPIKTAVFINGTLNDPRADNRFWSVEIALPLALYASNTTARAPPRRNDVWRINFSRVEWDVTVVGGNHYVKVPNRRENNWVWSPQYAINMHLPERWGFLVFGEFNHPPIDPLVATRWHIRTALAQAYYALVEFGAVNGYYSTNVSEWFLLPNSVVDGSLGTLPPVVDMPLVRWAWNNITVQDAYNSSIYGTIDSSRLITIFG